MTGALTGGCYCGALRYEMRGEPTGVNCCHCRDCQRLSGSAFAINAMVPMSALTLTQGTPAEDEPGTMRCGECHVRLWATHRFVGDETAFVRVGTLDTGELIAPTAHFFVRSKHPWVTIPEGIPAFQTLPHLENN